MAAPPWLSRKPPLKNYLSKVTPQKITSSPLSCRSKLLSLADSLTDESQLLTSLALNDTLSASMSRYDQLHARALAARAARAQSE